MNRFVFLYSAVFCALVIDGRRLTFNLTHTGSLNVGISDGSGRDLASTIPGYNLYTASTSGSLFFSFDVPPGNYWVLFQSSDPNNVVYFSASLAIDGVWASHSASDGLWRSYVFDWHYYGMEFAGDTFEQQYGVYYQPVMSECANLLTASAFYDGQIVQSKCLSPFGRPLGLCWNGVRYEDCFGYLRYKFVVPECPRNAACTLSNLTCNPGYEYRPISDPCTPCSLGTYKSSAGNSKCLPCPPLAFCNQTAILFQRCNLGFFSISDYQCEPCKAGYYCPDGVAQIECGPNSNTTADGSSSVSHCICNAGYFGSNGNCQMCPKGSYCVGGLSAQVCGLNSDTASLGSVNAGQCLCNPGYFGSDGNCQICPKGSYCLGGTHIQQCEQNGTTPSTGSVSSSQCKVVDLYECNSSQNCASPTAVPRRSGRPDWWANLWLTNQLLGIVLVIIFMALMVVLGFLSGFLTESRIIRRRRHSDRRGPVDDEKSGPFVAVFSAKPGDERPAHFKHAMSPSKDTDESIVTADPLPSFRVNRKDIFSIMTGQYSAAETTWSASSSERAAGDQP